MNSELITKLYNQSLVDSGLEGLGGSYKDLDVERFAKLIVTECVRVVESGMDYTDRA